MHSLSRATLIFCCALSLGQLTACLNNSDGPEKINAPVAPVAVEFEQDTVVETSVLRFVLKGTSSLVVRRAGISVNGTLNDGEGVKWSYEARASDALKADDASTGAVLYRINGDTGDLVLELPMELGLWGAIQGDQSKTFTGHVTLSLIDPFDKAIAEAKVEVSLRALAQVPLSVGSIPSGDVYLNELIEVSGDNFLREDEGQSVAVIESGLMTLEDGSTRVVEDVALPFVWGGSRQRAYLKIDPKVFGVKTGEFTGNLVFENRLRNGTSADGQRQDGLSFALQPSFISVPSPDRGSRGQRITIKGRGLIDTGDGVGMTLIFQGKLTPDGGGEPLLFDAENAQERVPDRYIDNQNVEVAVWYDITEFRGRTLLTGLGALPGVFDGTITPRFFDSFGQRQDGVSYRGTFTILPTQQLVYLKYLPRFSQGLAKYGLRNVEREIRTRILNAAQRPYLNTSVRFVDEIPKDFIDYATIEVSGPDPFGRKTFGLDNSFNGVAKDTDNLFLADYVGGWNKGSEQNFDNPFGGIYIESFDYFSPTVTGTRPDGSTNDDASPEFDSILKPFMPALNGTPVKATEWPDGPRAGSIQGAIDMIGVVVGHTVAHEAGHSMGMSFYEGDRSSPGNSFHNRAPGDGELMDPGSSISFEERAGLEGAPVLEFNARNTDYMREILPKITP